ncbi:MAG: SpoIIE family protein phosphatase [Treponema sp.]|nr:SpoIIE family protein phosphatase [Treponema sp.]
MKKKFRISVLALELIFGAVIFGAIMCLVNSFNGYREFKQELEIIYGTVTEQFAQTAATYVNGDKIDHWLTNGADQEWEETTRRLEDITEAAEIVYVAVMKVSSDYSHRIYIFDTVNSKEVNSKVYELGYRQSLEKKTAGYIEKLRDILEQGKSNSMFSYKKGGGHVTSSVPLYNSAGKPCAIVSVYKPMHEIKAYKKRFLKSIIIWALVVTIAFVALYALFLYLGIIRPILFVTEETSHLAEHHGELTGLLKKVHGHNEIGSLAKSVEKMSLDMNRYIRDLTNATAEKERLGAELNVAKKIQAEMLPRVFPPYDNHKEVELFASMEPAKEVGGDFYDFYMIDDDHFAVVVGDVSGKGVPAALFMVITKTLLKDTAAHELDPAKIFEHVNNILCEGNESGLFVTCWMGIITLSTGELKFANAGHNAPIIIQNGEIKYLTTKPNLMLAGMNGLPYTTHTTKLAKDDQLFIYTDGVTEATNIYNELYGENRLLTVMKAGIGKNPRDVISIVRNDINSFVQEAPQFDDITMLEMAFKSR